MLQGRQRGGRFDLPVTRSVVAAAADGDRASCFGAAGTTKDDPLAPPGIGRGAGTTLGPCPLAIHSSGSPSPSVPPPPVSSANSGHGPAASGP